MELALVIFGTVALFPLAILSLTVLLAREERRTIEAHNRRIDNARALPMRIELIPPNRRLEG